MRNYVVVGSGSEISQSFQKLLAKRNIPFFSISRSTSNNPKHLKVNDYLKELDHIKDFIAEVENPTVIFFNGFLAENRNIKNPDLSEIELTDYINFQVPYFLTRELSIKTHIKKFIFISSIASVRARNKNYIYGLSKNKLEKSIKFLGLSSYLVIRFGKVESKMSKGHKNPPFTMTCDEAAKAIFQKLNNRGITHASFGIYLSRIFLLILPQKIIDRF